MEVINKSVCKVNNQPEVWQSGALLLGTCCQKLFDCKLDNYKVHDGFYYDLQTDIKITQDDLLKINQLANEIKDYNIKVFECISVNWLSNGLTRIHAICFPDKKMLKEWKLAKEEAAKRDHRVIGKNQKLFFFHEYSPGSAFFLPHGTKIYNTLVDFIKKQYLKRGFNEVVTPNMFNVKLWEQSNHWHYYKDNMFSFNVEDDLYALKPMNCPGHCLLFNSSNKSYKELPLRIADFGVLHRNELSGTLTGLTRVRRFCQDDAHIFCTEDQVESEIDHCLEFLETVYNIFGFTFTLSLSTRPEKYIGTIDIWDKAEAQLTKSLNKRHEWQLNEGDGAFYGPKIDIQIKDANGKEHQCATIQLDFNLPDKFNLHFQQADGNIGRPVMIHRAILGSIERIIAILCEHYGGKWPLWLSPRQICVIPIDPSYNDYAKQVVEIYSNYNVEIDLSADKLNKKVRNAQLEQFNYIFVVGQQEQDSNTVSVRVRDSKISVVYQHDDMIKKLNYLIDNHSL